MDTKEAGAKGGSKSRANMTPEQVQEAASAAGKASWQGHIKGSESCACPQCTTRRK